MELPVKRLSLFRSCFNPSGLLDREMGRDSGRDRDVEGVNRDMDKDKDMDMTVPLPPFLHVPTALVTALAYVFGQVPALSMHVHMSLVVPLSLPLHCPVLPGPLSGRDCSCLVCFVLSCPILSCPFPFTCPCHCSCPYPALFVFVRVFVCNFPCPSSPCSVLFRDMDMDTARDLRPGGR